MGALAAGTPPPHALVARAQALAFSGGCAAARHAEVCAWFPLELSSSTCPNPVWTFSASSPAFDHRPLAGELLLRSRAAPRSLRLGLNPPFSFETYSFFHLLSLGGDTNARNPEVTFGCSLSLTSQHPGIPKP